MDERIYPMYCDANDGGIKRGDRADTGDLEARPKRGVGRAGSGVPPDSASGHVTGSPDAIAEAVNEGALGDETEVVDEPGYEDLDVRDATDPSLGLTSVPGHPPEDWAADTGPTRNPGDIRHTAEPAGGPAAPRKKRR